MARIPENWRGQHSSPHPDEKFGRKNGSKRDQKSNLNFEPGTIWNADNLDVMRGMNSETVDLFYLDPPFNSARNYQGQSNKFLDDWSEKQLSEWEMLDGIRNSQELLKQESWWSSLEVIKEHHSDAMYYYISFMAVRLIKMRRILKPTGSLYLHCDDSSNSYLRMILDIIFGHKNGAGSEGTGAEIT